MPEARYPVAFLGQNPTGRKYGRRVDFFYKTVNSYP